MVIIMARQVSSNSRSCADIWIVFLEGAVTVYVILRMLESVLQELGFEPLDTQCLAVVLYLVLSAQLCLLLSWPWDARATRPTGSTSGRKGGLLLRVYAAVLGLLLLAEAGLALYGIAHAWTGLLWDVTLVATVQAFLCAAVFVAIDGRFKKVDRVHRVQDDAAVLSVRRRRPGG